MHRFFNPLSIAVIGVPSRSGVGAINNVETILRYGYTGQIYPVNPEATEICGRKAYASVRDIAVTADSVVGTRIHKPSVYDFNALLTH
jgi:acetyltransferase